jgi:hypothetical protein
MDPIADPVFWTAAKECRKYAFGIGSIDALTKALVEWEEFLKRHNHPIKILEFKEAFYHELCKMFDSIKDIDDIRQITLRIFGNIFAIPNEPCTSISSITSMFTNLIKGITYFGMKVPDFPIYHRLHETSSPSCYLERLIYDQCAARGCGHVKDHFGINYKCDFTIDIDYIDNVWPYKLTIIKRRSIEIYEKTMYIDKDGIRRYDPFVECTKKLVLQNVVYNYKKVQGFRRPDKWIRV